MLKVTLDVCEDFDVVEQPVTEPELMFCVHAAKSGGSLHKGDVCRGDSSGRTRPLVELLSL